MTEDISQIQLPPKHLGHVTCISAAVSGHLHNIDVHVFLYDVTFVKSKSTKVNAHYVLLTKFFLN